MQVIEDLPHDRHGPAYLAGLISWLVMTWWHWQSGHQQLCNWPSSPEIFGFQHQEDGEYKGQVSGWFYLHGYATLAVIPGTTLPYRYPIITHIGSYDTTDLCSSFSWSLGWVLEIGCSFLILLKSLLLTWRLGAFDKAYDLQMSCIHQEKLGYINSTFSDSPELFDRVSVLVVVISLSVIEAQRQPNSRDPAAAVGSGAPVRFLEKRTSSLHLPYESPFSIMTVPCQRSLPIYRHVGAIFALFLYRYSLWRPKILSLWHILCTIGRHIGYLQWFTHAYHILICDGVTNTRVPFSYI